MVLSFPSWEAAALSAAENRSIHAKTLGKYVAEIKGNKDEPCVVVDGAADGEDGDAAVEGADCGDVGTGHGWWLVLV
ncbi:hypothetical protein HYALB_00006637 [Hymenoscyphus albidus]|uniref:Uncharacterized protein n=1 Tax=Hymenoscyphus albidus TaxID=595503 RepID=A0A9N9Q1V5_9HELO|nr:hypothetical protein HYALB_00006637 [Hymenoscyphus albidus]